MTKQNIQRLIKSNLINVKLVSGLSDLDLSSEDYFLEIPDILLSILNIHIDDDTFDHYESLYKKVVDIDLNDSDALNELVNEIHQYLIKLQMN